MPDLLERRNTITTPVRRVVQTGAAGVQVVAPPSNDWDDLISATLLQWERNPSLLLDEEYPSPSPEVVQCALQVARVYRVEGVETPLRIIPTASGGISFEWDSYPTFESLTVRPDCSLDWKRFEFGSLISRRQSPGSVVVGADDDAAR
jgi:hypothetical protein